MPADTRPVFQQVQQQMTDWLRDPDSHPAPSVEQRRLDIYRELFFNNVCDFVETAYPVLKSLLPEEEWSALLRDFFSGHRCQSPYFRDISLEFRTWVEASRTELVASRPWVQELLHYEWFELAAECAETEGEGCEVDPDANLLDGIPVAGPHVWPLAYRWPVHALDPDELSASPPDSPTFLIVFRDDEDRVRILEVTALTARLVELLQQNTERSGRYVLAQLAGEAGADADTFVAAGESLLADLRQQGVLLGTSSDAGRLLAAR